MTSLSAESGNKAAAWSNGSPWACPHFISFSAFNSLPTSRFILENKGTLFHFFASLPISSVKVFRSQDCALLTDTCPTYLRSYCCNTKLGCCAYVGNHWIWGILHVPYPHKLATSWGQTLYLESQQSTGIQGALKVYEVTAPYPEYLTIYSGIYTARISTDSCKGYKRTEITSMENTEMGLMLCVHWGSIWENLQAHMDKVFFFPSI